MFENPKWITQSKKDNAESCRTTHHGQSTSRLEKGLLLLHLTQPQIPHVGYTSKTGRNDDWLSKGSSSAKALLSNLPTKEVFDELFQGLQAEPQVKWSLMGQISR